MIFTSFSSQAGGGGSSCVLREAEVGSFKWLWQSECVLTCVCSCVTRKAYLTSETGTLCPLGQAAAPEWQTSTRQFSPTCRLTLFISDSCTHVNMTNEQWGLSLKIQSFHVPLWHQSIFPGCLYHVSEAIVDFLIADVFMHRSKPSKLSLLVWFWWNYSCQAFHW